MLFIVLFILLVTLVLCYSISKHHYWARKGIYVPPSYPLIGNAHQIFGYPWEFNDEVYKKAKKYDFAGFYEFLTPKLYLYNPEHIRLVLVKDFDHFVDRRTFKVQSKDSKVFNDMLTNVTGDYWKFIRAILTPSFTSGKLKAMFPLVSDIADELVSLCRASVKSGSPVEMHDAFGRYALDVIACCAFGIEGKTIEQGESEFYKLMKGLTEFKLLNVLKFLVFMMSPKFFGLLGLSFFSKKHSDLIKIVKTSINERRKNSSAHRGDFVDLILEAQKNAEKKEIQKFDFDEDSMIAQSMLFLLAGFDTVKNTASFLLNDLAKYPEEQQKVREELLELTQEEGITYQNIMEAKFLDAFVCESMRITPSAYVTERCCTQSYKVPGTDLIIPKDEIVDIPVWSLHRDPEYWEDPLEFRSSRFLPENKDKIIPYTYMPFGLGPRNCIGSRFALMEMKVVVAKLILTFEITHPPDFEMKLKKSPMALRPDSKGVLLNLKPLPEAIPS